MKKVVAHSAPKPLLRNAPTLGRVAAVVLVVVLALQLIGIGKVVSGLDAQFESHAWAIAVTIIALSIEVATIPFLLRLKLSYLASLSSGVAAVFAPWVWVLVTVWSVGLPDVGAAQFGVIDGLRISWGLFAINVIWLIYNFYTVKQLNIEKVWYSATGLKPRSELKKAKK